MTMLRCGGSALLLLAVVRSAAADPYADATAAYDEGLRLYDLREWDAAIAKFKEAYRLRPDAPSLFNLAQAERLKGDCAEAVAFYRTYKRNFPEASNLAKVDKLITELEPCPAKPVVVTPPPPQPVIVTPPLPVVVKPIAPVHHTDVAAIALVAGGGAAIVVGGLFAHAAGQRADDVTHLTGTWDPSLQQAGERDAHVGIALIAVGAAAVVAGIGYHFFVRSEQITVAPQPGGVALAGSF